MMRKAQYEMIKFGWDKRGRSSCYELADALRANMRLPLLPDYTGALIAYTRETIPRDFILKAMKSSPRAAKAEGGAIDGDHALVDGKYGLALFTYCDGEWLGFGVDGFSHWHDHYEITKIAHSFWRVD